MMTEQHKHSRLQMTRRTKLTKGNPKHWRNNHRKLIFKQHNMVFAKSFYVRQLGWGVGRGEETEDMKKRDRKGVREGELVLGIQHLF